jgi:hypothetical protein
MRIEIQHSIIALLTVVGFFTAIASGQRLTGTVIDADGVPLADVWVHPDGHIYSVTTNRSGVFELSEKSHGAWLRDGLSRLLFFHKTGFQPQVHVFEKDALPLVVKLSAIGREVEGISLCKLPILKDVRLSGKKLSILHPKRLKYRDRSNWEYQSFTVGLKISGEKHEISSSRFGFVGPFPPGSFILNSTEYQVVSNPPVLDWRGTLKDGTFWRYIGPPFNSWEAYQYSTRSKEASVAFDNILNTLCLNPSDPEGNS